MVRIWRKAFLYIGEKINHHLNHNYFYSINNAKTGSSIVKKVNENKEKKNENKNQQDQDQQHQHNGDDENTPSSVLDPIQELIKLEVKNLWDSIPELFKRISIINSSMNPNILKLMSSYNILYYSIIIHIYRPQIVHKKFLWSTNNKKNSYNRMVCLQSAQRIARFIYYYMKCGVMDLIPNASMFPIFEAVIVLLDDFRAEKNLLKKCSIKVNYEEKKKKLLILNIFIIFYYHRARHQLNANVILKLIYDFVKEKWDNK